MFVPVPPAQCSYKMLLYYISRYVNKNVILNFLCTRTSSKAKYIYLPSEEVDWTIIDSLKFPNDGRF